MTFGNGNLPGFGIQQVMIVSCPASANCSSAASWTAPVKVGDQSELHPVGPSAEGCPGGRQCLPPNGYRVPMITSISESIDSSGKLYVSWTDGRNLAANCQGPAASATPPCDSDIYYAYSTDGGASWSASVKLTPAGSAQWQSWSSVTADGTLFVGYYDRSYGNCEIRRLQRHHAGQGQECGLGLADNWIHAHDHLVHAQPDPGQQPASGRLPG